MKRLRLHIILPLLLGIILVFIPLLRDFHFETAFLSTIIGCFTGAYALAGNKNGQDLKISLKVLGSVCLIGLPPFLHALFSGCLTFDGFGFWVLLVIPGVLLGAATGRLFRTLEFPKPVLFSWLSLLIIAVGAWLIEFFTLPQVYFFNQVWGYWPGPIYDEQLPVTESLLFFRWTTVLWILLLWIIPVWSKNNINKLIFGLSFISLMLSYLYLDEMTVITPRESLKSQLSTHYETTHFDLYFDEELFDEQEVAYWAAKHEFYFNDIVTQLNVEWPDGRKIESYLYAHAWQKKKLVGAKFTSYVPIWLEQDQLHIAKQQLEGVLKHELVHVISKQFGNWLYNGSKSIGLIEGLAEAIARDASSESTLDQIIAAEKPYPTEEEIRNALSNTGFYGASSPISYTTAGSFISHLLSNYPVEYFKATYPSAEYNAYPVSFSELVNQWHQHLDSVQVDQVDTQISEFIFSSRSLFQRSCPHVFSREFYLWDTFNLHLANKDTSNALVTIEGLIERQPENKLVKREWVRLQLLSNKYSSALYSFDESDSLLTLQLLKADALFLSNDVPAAQRLLEEVKPRLDSVEARNFRYSYTLRSDSLNWSAFLNSRYKNQLPNMKIYRQLNYPVQLLTASRAAELGKIELLKNYSETMLAQKPDAHWFGVYEQVIDQLILYNHSEISDKWLSSLSDMKLRPRYEERLDELYKWTTFITQTN